MDVYMQFVPSDNCKTPLYITRITPNKMILRKKKKKNICLRKCKCLPLTKS